VIAVRLSALVFAFLSACAAAETVLGRVVGISDGDTITLLDRTNTQHKIRLAGIDAPEAQQPFGQKSKANLSALAFGREASAECGKIDRYRREVCKITVNGIDLNVEQVRADMAWWYRKYANEQSPEDRSAYEQVQFWAQARRLGLWADKNPVPPWEWRHR
jgi:endonuclease YncB( thermonuclease family)